MAVFIFTLDMLQVFSFDEKYQVHMHHAAMWQGRRQNLILCAVSLVSQNLYVEYLNQFHIFIARKYAVFQVFSFDEKYQVHMHYAAMWQGRRQNLILCAVSLVSQNLYVEYLNQFHIFIARKYAVFGHSAYCRNHFGRFLHL